MRPARVLLLFNEPVLPAGHPDAASEREILETVELVQHALSDDGITVNRLGVGNDLQQLINGLRNGRPDAVFNLFEGLADRPFTESVVAGMLEWFDIPFTGCPADTLGLARNKQRAKHLMRGADLPTAPFFTVERLPAPECSLPWPVIVKPVAQDASVGIDQASVVSNQKQMESRVAHVLVRYGAALVEQYIAGREFQVSLIEVTPDARRRCPLEALPLAEIAFSDSSIWPIYSYDAKWTPTSNEHRSSPIRIAPDVSDALREQVVHLAQRAYRLLGCRDYARVDFRVTSEGQPHILEVNPNPCLNSSEMIDGLAAINRTHAGFISNLARAALGRDKRSAVTARRGVRASSVPVGGENTETA